MPGLRSASRTSSRVNSAESVTGISTPTLLSRPPRCTRFAARRPQRACLASVDPHLPAPRGRPALVQEAIRPATAELGVAEVGDAAEHRRDPAPRPAHLVLDLREDARLVGRLGERVEQL